MNTTARRYLVAAFLLLPPWRALHAQCSGACAQFTVRLPVYATFRLTLNSLSTPLGNPTAADFQAGFKDAPGPQATVQANRSYQVQVQATGPFTVPSGTKPASDLLWGTVSGTYPNHTGTGAVLLSGGPTSGTSQLIFFRTNWGFANNPPGNYSLTVRYTISAP